MVTAKGRLFYVIDDGVRASMIMPPDWKLVARDAFNGVLLWERKIEPLVADTLADEERSGEPAAAAGGRRR